MPLPHSIDNYTVPGGVKLFFDDGAGERDLGNITDLDIETGTEELEHYSNRSGKRMKDKAFARAVSRDDLRRGAEELGVELDEHIGFVIAAMTRVADRLGLAGEQEETV